MDWYTGNTTYDLILTLGFAYVGIVVVAAPFVDTPYGRFASEKFGISLGPRFGWFLMELPATLFFFAVFFSGSHWSEPVPLVFAAMWALHYANRGFFFPFCIRAPKAAKGSFSLMVVVTGWLATSMHGYLNAAYMSELGEYSAWFGDERFWAGLMVYYTSFILTLHSDSIIRNLRSKEEVARGEKVYRIPQGGLFRWVTCPSYLCEIIGWAGFALCTWSLGSVFVLGITIANLVPRALATHSWYRKRFEDYPKDRKALIPFVL